LLQARFKRKRRVIPGGFRPRRFRHRFIIVGRVVYKENLPVLGARSSVGLSACFTRSATVSKAAIHAGTTQSVNTILLR
jgi:hypothetical protein